MSKGSARRPRAIDSNTEAEHWDNTFRPLHTTAQQAEGMVDWGEVLTSMARQSRSEEARTLILASIEKQRTETGEDTLNRSLRDIQERECL